MEEVTITKWECAICGQHYDTSLEATVCESRPVSMDAGYAVGDVVRITAGDGAGQLARITSRKIIDKDWGHYAWERYWHTPGYTADVIGTPYSRMLTFDQLERPDA